MVSIETKVRIKIDQLIGGLDNKNLSNGGHLFETMITNCTWKGIDCKYG